jgi:penicillin-binding protein 1B
MLRAGAITTENYERAKRSELEISEATADATDAPYLVIHEELLKDYSEEELMSGGLSIYTTLDPDLQKAAVEAIAKGMVFVEKQLAAHITERKKSPDLQRPQAGLIALDPRTGEIKAMVGGTNYAASQYNRITQAFRQPGSAFKPFVYAAALESPYDSAPEAPNFDAEPHVQSLDDPFITLLTTVIDAPKPFFYGGAIYNPNNYGDDYRGLVTVRTAFQRSLNLATIRIAERVGFDRVAALAKRMGLNVEGYPSVALGAFEVTPLELAGATRRSRTKGSAVSRMRSSGWSRPMAES